MTSSAIRAKSILADFAMSRGLTVGQFLSKHQFRALAHARQDAMRIIYDTTSLGYAPIGRLFDKHHTTVMHGIAASRARAEK